MSSLLLNASQCCSVLKNVTPSLVGKLIVRNRQGLRRQDEISVRKSVLSQVNGRLSLLSSGQRQSQSLRGQQKLLKGQRHPSCLGRLFVRNEDGSSQQTFLKLAGPRPVKWNGNERRHLNIPCGPCGTETETETESKVLSGKEWWNCCLRASVLDVVIALIKLSLTLVVEAFKAIYRMIRSIFGAKHEDKFEKLDEAAKRARTKADEMNKQYGPEVRKNIEKTQTMIKTELPKLKDKMEKDVPVMKKNMGEFTDRFGNEMKSAKTPEEKRDKVFAMLGELVQSNKYVQGFIIFMTLYILFKIFKLLFFR